MRSYLKNSKAIVSSWFMIQRHQSREIYRKYSLDEVPQFLNVLKGEMSIVGPRAYYQDELDHQLTKFKDVKDEVDLVLSVRPGITGLWQVSGRSDVNFDKRIKLDAQYARDLSLIRDLGIIIKTPIAMITGRGAV
jgi:undecaprenyl-phosphate galactose phosphotransferase